MGERMRPKPSTTSKNHIESLLVRAVTIGRPHFVGLISIALALKQAILDKTTPPEGKPGRYRPDDRLLAFLKGL